MEQISKLITVDDVQYMYTKIDREEEYVINVLSRHSRDKETDYIHYALSNDCKTWRVFRENDKLQQVRTHIKSTNIHEVIRQIEDFNNGGNHGKDNSDIMH